MQNTVVEGERGWKMHWEDMETRKEKKENIASKTFFDVLIY